MVKAYGCSAYQYGFWIIVVTAPAILEADPRPLNLLQPADMPVAAKYIEFHSDSFPLAWDCVPFTFSLRYEVFGPQREEIRKIPGFVIRLPGGQVVAYSRICPAHGYIINYVIKPAEYNCGCVIKGQKCCCAVNYDTALLICPCDGSAFDVADGGRVVAGPAPRPLRRFQLTQSNKVITITAIEQGPIA